VGGLSSVSTVDVGREVHGLANLASRGTYLVVRGSPLLLEITSLSVDMGKVAGSDTYMDRETQNPIIQGAGSPWQLLYRSCVKGYSAAENINFDICLNNHRVPG
jgi:hypothetical protein